LAEDLGLVEVTARWEPRPEQVPVRFEWSGAVDEHVGQVQIDDLRSDLQHVAPIPEREPVGPNPATARALRRFET
jgi:hypothetical protein